jgi:hypothetical protein
LKNLEHMAAMMAVMHTAPAVQESSASRDLMLVLLLL